MGVGEMVVVEPVTVVLIRWTVRTLVVMSGGRTTVQGYEQVTVRPPACLESLTTHPTPSPGINRLDFGNRNIVVCCNLGTESAGLDLEGRACSVGERFGSVIGWYALGATHDLADLNGRTEIAGRLVLVKWCCGYAALCHKNYVCVSGYYHLVWTASRPRGKCWCRKDPQVLRGLQLDGSGSIDTWTFIPTLKDPLDITKGVVRRAGHNANWTLCMVSAVLKKNRLSNPLCSNVGFQYFASGISMPHGSSQGRPQTCPDDCPRSGVSNRRVGDAVLPGTHEVVRRCGDITAESGIGSTRVARYHLLQGDGISDCNAAFCKSAVVKLMV